MITNGVSRPSSFARASAPAMVALLVGLPLAFIAGCGNGWRGLGGDDGDGGGGSSASGAARGDIEGEWILVAYEYPDDDEVVPQEGAASWRFDEDGSNHGSLYIEGDYQGDWFVAPRPGGELELDESFQSYLTIESDGFLPYSYGIRRLTSTSLELQHDVGIGSNRIDRFRRPGSGPGSSSGPGGGSSGTGTATCDPDVTIAAVEVDAAGETPTGIYVEEGDTMVFTALGEWCWGGGGDCSDADGTPGRPLSGELPVTVDGAALGALGARVGGRFFEIGACRTIVMPEAGDLALFMNDSVGRYDDNEGSLLVQIGR